jgi:Na+-translocating ferredoxin:NAD+ oxidoreductase RnfG subunit
MKMTKTKTALIASAMALLSTQVFAATAHQTTRVVTTADMSSKAAAYDSAFKKLEALKTDSAIELNNELGHIAMTYPNSIVLNDGAYVTVTEKMNENGQLFYTGLVNVTVTFDIAD